MNATELTKYLIENNLYMIIATADKAGKPWISPVFFDYDHAYNFYWVSAKDAQHSKNVRARPQIAISIIGPPPEGGMEGVYIDAEATELTDEADIQEAIPVLHKRPQSDKFIVHSIADVTGDRVWRIYKAIPREISKRIDAAANGQAITDRVHIDLPALTANDSQSK